MFVIYNKETTRYLRVIRNRDWADAMFKTLAAAKAHMTRNNVDSNVYAIAEYKDFVKNIEKKVTVRNLMSGKDVVQSINTPRCCDVSSELYWSM